MKQISHEASNMGCALDSYGCCNKLPLTCWLETSQISSLTVLEGQKSKMSLTGLNQGGSRADSFWRFWGRICFPTLSIFWGWLCTLGGFRPSAHHLSPPLPPAPTPPSSVIKSASVCLLQGRLWSHSGSTWRIQNNLLHLQILNSILSAKSFLPHKVTQAPRMRTWISLGTLTQPYHRVRTIITFYSYIFPFDKARVSHE